MLIPGAALLGVLLQKHLKSPSLYGKKILVLQACFTALFLFTLLRIFLKPLTEDSTLLFFILYQAVDFIESVVISRFFLVYALLSLYVDLFDINIREIHLKLYLYVLVFCRAFSLVIKPSSAVAYDQIKLISEILFLLSIVYLIVMGFRSLKQSDKPSIKRLNLYSVMILCMALVCSLAEPLLGWSNFMALVILALYLFLLFVLYSYSSIPEIRKGLNYERIIKDYGISSRELDILKLIIAGRNNDEIGTELFISVNTVKFHAKNIYKKLEVNNRVQLLNRVNAL